MGWFLRKSFRVGPLRLNLSKRGIGASVGVKGARLGVDATGKPYAAGGRHGIYFRESLGTSQPQEPAGEMGPAGEGEASSPHGPRWWVIVLLALAIGIIVGVVLARAGEQARAGSPPMKAAIIAPGGRPQAGLAARGESTSPEGDQT